MIQPIHSFPATSTGGEGAERKEQASPGPAAQTRDRLAVTTNEDHGYMERLSEAVMRMMSPLEASQVEITERCPHCHLPLHDGRELRWKRNGSTMQRMSARHRCTGLDLPDRLYNLR